MKKLIFFGLILISVLAHSQQVINVSKEAEKTTLAITSTQINGGDSVLLSANMSNIEYIEFTLGTGTAYAGTGTDSTLIYVKKNGVKNACGYIPDTWIKDTNASGAVQSFDVKECKHDPNSPVWIDFAPQYTTGTKSLISKNYHK